MDWLRRNWPDLLIGLALVAVIAGIVATLLTGGSFFPLGEGTTSAAVERGARPEQSTATEAGPDGENAADAARAGGPAAGAEGSAASGAATSEEDPAPDASGEDGPSVAVLPAREGDQDGATSAPAAAPDDDAQEGTAAEGQAVPQPLPVDEEDAASSASATLPDEGAASADATTAPQSDPNAGLPTDPFRVSVGAFSSSDNAERQAARFRGEGYPVFVGAQGELSIVLVGPYQERARAEQVASEITEQHDDVDPVIYRYEPEGNAREGANNVGTAEASAAPGTTASEASEPSESTEASASSEAAAPAPAADVSGAAAAVDDPVRLQVGAYATPDSAAPQVERLDGLGFHEVEQVRDGGLIRLIVGPYQGQALQDARALLDGAGIEYFPR